MARSKTYTTQFKRKIKGKTNYKKRLNYLKSKKIRLMIRISTNNVILQAVKFETDGDKVLNTTRATELRKFGWSYNTGNIPAAYLAGLLFGTKIKDKVNEGIIDLGLQSITKGTRIPAAIKGIADSGIKINYEESILPSEDTLSGKIIAKFAEELSKEKEKYEKQFSKYLKDNQKPENMNEIFQKVKKKLMENKK